MINAGAQKLHHFRRSAHVRFRALVCRDGTAALPDHRAIPHRLIARVTGSSKSMIQKIEAGDRTPGLKLALRLQQLGVADPEDWQRPAITERSI